MRVEIHDRFNDIIENDPNLRYAGSPIFKTFTDMYPSSLDRTKLPCVLWLPRQDAGYEKKAGYEYETVVEYEGHFYYGLITDGLSTIANIRVLKLPDLIKSAFLSRPHLDYNDAGLNGVNGEITFRFTSDLAVPKRYPLNAEEPLYWGSTARITVPFEEFIELALPT